MKTLTRDYIATATSIIGDLHAADPASAVDYVTGQRGIADRALAVDPGDPLAHAHRLSADAGEEILRDLAGAR